MPKQIFKINVSWLNIAVKYSVGIHLLSELVITCIKFERIGSSNSITEKFNYQNQVINLKNIRNSKIEKFKKILRMISKYFNMLELCIYQIHMVVDKIKVTNQQMVFKNRCLLRCITYKNNFIGL